MVALLKQPQPVDSLKMDRRAFPRKEVHTCVEGRRHDHTLEALRDPRVSLAMRDLSVGGLSAISSMPLRSGERISVFFPPQGINRGWDACGKVLRCEPSAMGYRIAVEFEQLPAAA